MMAIPAEKLESLLELVATQDARIAALEAEIDSLSRERVFLKEGPAALRRQYAGPSSETPCQPGYIRGNAGQEVLADHQTIYALLRAQRRGEL